MGGDQQSRDTQKLAQTRRIIGRLLHQRQKYQTLIQQIEQFEQRYQCKLETLLDEKTPTRSVPFPIYQKLQQRFSFLRNSRYKPTERLMIDELQYQIEHPQKVDEEGFARFNYQTAAKHTGMSSSTPKRSIQAVLEQTPGYPVACKWDVPEVTQDGKKIECLYVKPKVPNLITASITVELEHKRKQGGNQYECQKCCSTNVIIERRLTCLDCGHTTMLESTYPNGKKKNSGKSVKSNLLLTDLPANTTNTTCNDQPAPAENFLISDAQPVGMVITSDPPHADKLAESPVEIENESETNEIEEAAALLLAIAGDDQKHIEMSRTGEKKYYQVNRPLQLSDLVEHFKGGQARGALCSYRDGQTRALCFDADDPETWESLKRGARQLAQAGYSTILEESPAERGGHLWIIYTDKVSAADARAAVCKLAPELGEIPEYWPAPASMVTWNRVRLPGGFYARYGRYVEQPVKAWCTLLNAATGETGSSGISAATLLLTSLTPAAIVPAIQNQDGQASASTQDEQASQGEACSIAQQPEPESPTSAAGRAAPLHNTDQAEQGSRLPEVDARWSKDNGEVSTTTLYFAITARYAAGWFNEHHSLEEIRSRERNGLALSPNGNERTASTSYRGTPEGERYTDHSQHGRRSDGTRDTGDALELTAKVQHVSKGQLISQTTREIQGQARTELESAARAGKAIPAWIEEIITPAGRRQYMKWLNAQGQDDQDEARRQIVTRPAQPEQKRAAEIRPAAPAPARQVEQPESAPQIDNQADQRPPLAEGQRVSTSAGIATISIVRYCDILHRWRCSVFTDKKQPDGSHYAIFDATEVGPMEQGTLFY